MSSWGSFDYSSFKDFADNLDKGLRKQTAESFLLELMNSIGDIALTNVKENTPVGQYESGMVEFTATDADGNPVEVSFYASTTQVGGNLRDGWKVSKAEVSGKNVTLTLSNAVEYAIPVEKGHRIVRNGVTLGWVEGQFFVETTMEELAEKLEDFIEPEFEDYLLDLIGGE